MSSQPLQSFSINCRYGTAAATLPLIIWLWVALDRPYEIPNRVYWNVYSNRPSSQPVDAFNFDPIESEAIKSVCEDTDWKDDLVFTCDESVGGVGNMRNSILNCVRYTISAGAALVLPSIVLRDSDDISHIRTDDRTNLAYMFDIQHFIASLSLSCPGLRIFHSVLEIDDYKSAHKAIPLLPESLLDRIPTTGTPEPEAWLRKFEKRLDQYGTREGTEPIIVHLGRSYMQYPIYSDGEDFAHSFGNILKFRADVRMLATNTLLAMSKIYDLQMDYLDGAQMLSDEYSQFYGVSRAYPEYAACLWP